MGFSATLRRTRRPLACVPLLCTLVAVPTAALARTPHGGTGGVGITGSGGGSTQTTTTSTSTSTTTVTPGTLAPGVVKLGGVVNASGDGITLTVAASGIQGQPLTITGKAPTDDAGALIDIESTKADQATWTQVATATIGSSGSFSAQWTPATSAQVALRAVLATAAATPGTGSSSGGTGSTNGATGLSGAGTESASAASGELTTSSLTIPIFRDALATLYGPGFWGHRTACGERLTHAMLGVASRTLKCGTRVAVFYRGREITVPVIDRGPFANGARWDLTMATAKALGIKETATVGTLSSGLAPASAARS